MFVRKLAGLCLALALVYSISFPARADELLKNFKVDGSIETRSFGIDNERDRNSVTDDYRSVTQTRLMLGGSFDVLDDVHSRVQLLKNDAIFGGTGQGQALNGTIGNGVEENIDVVNAYVKVDKVFNHVDLTIGRQFYGRSDDLVIYYGANNDDVLSVNSVDVFRADSDIMGWAKFQGIAGKIVGNNTTTGTNTDNDTDLFGAEVNTDKVIPKGNLAAYYYTDEAKKDANGVDIGNNTLNVYGLRAAGDIIAGLGYQAEIIGNSGRDEVSATDRPAYDGSAYFLALKYNQDLKNMPVRASAEYGRGSDNFRAISAGKRFGIIWGEQTSVGPSTFGTSHGLEATGLNDLKVADVSVGVNPIKKLGIDLSWYRFRADAPSLLGNNSGKTSLGTEYDLVLSWKHSEHVTFEVNAADFQVGDAMQNAAPTGTSPITRLGADVKITF